MNTKSLFNLMIIELVNQIQTPIESKSQKAHKTCIPHQISLTKTQINYTKTCTKNKINKRKKIA